MIGVIFIVVIIIIIVIVIYNNRELSNEVFEDVIEVFDKSNDINLIKSKINDYDCHKKIIIINDISNILITRKKIKLDIIMKQNLRNRHSPITKKIIKQELLFLDVEFNSYKNNLNSKKDKLMKIIIKENVEIKKIQRIDEIYNSIQKKHYKHIYR
jgi:hypothetical protein